MARLKALPPRLRLEAAPPRVEKWRGSRHERGYGSAWVRLRAQVLARDHGLCRPCLMAGRTTAATSVDHIVPKIEGGSDDPVNLQAICTSCHATKSAYEGFAAPGARKPLGRYRSNG